MGSAAVQAALALSVAASAAHADDNVCGARRIASGQAIYALNCSSCHGAHGEAARAGTIPMHPAKYHRLRTVAKVIHRSAPMQCSTASSRTVGGTHATRRID